MLRYQILSALNLRHRRPNVIACPSCARTLGFDVIRMASKVEEALKNYEDHFIFEEIEKDGRK